MISSCFICRTTRSLRRPGCWLRVWVAGWRRGWYLCCGLLCTAARCTRVRELMGWVGGVVRVYQMKEGRTELTCMYRQPYIFRVSTDYPGGADQFSRCTPILPAGASRPPPSSPATRSGSVASGSGTSLVAASSVTAGATVAANSSSSTAASPGGHHAGHRRQQSRMRQPP